MNGSPVIARTDTRAEALRMLKARRDALRRGRWSSTEEGRLYMSGSHRVRDELEAVERRIALIEAMQ